MSYGWLAESALLPKKSKQIKIEDESSLFGLKAALKREKEKIDTHGGSRKIYKIQKKPVKNAGVEERIKRDEASLGVLENRMKDSSKKLQIKEKIYGELLAEKKNASKLLVDFKSKEDQDEDEDFQKLRDKFYAGKIEELKKDAVDEEPQFIQDNYRERRAWEKELYRQLEGVVQTKEKVKQVFDRKLEASQKEALNEVREELSKQQKILEQAHKRRQTLKIQRMSKLKQLSIFEKEEKEQN